MAIKSKKISDFLRNKWPLYNRLGVYSFFPIFFISGAVFELFLINFTFKNQNFYKTFKKRRLADLKLEIEEQERLIASYEKEKISQ